MDFHTVKIHSKDPLGSPFGTIVEFDGRPLYGVQAVSFNQSTKEFTKISITLIGHIEFEPDNTFVTFVTEDGRKFKVIKEES